MMSSEINELAAALAKAQGAMKNAAMNRVNPHFKSRYADLSSVLDAIRGPLSANGLSIVQTMQPGERATVLRTTLLHSSGQFIATEYPIATGLDPHKMGSALTYARRYSVSALICNSADEDDDGNEAMKAKPTNGNGNNTQRQNPHVTRAEDIFPPTEYDENGDVVDNIPAPSPESVKKLRVVDQRPIFEELRKEIHATSHSDQLRLWGEDNKDRLGSLQLEWQKMLRGVYAEHRDALREQEDADERRIAG